MQKSLLLAATLALTTGAMAQQPVRPASVAAQATGGQFVAKRQLPQMGSFEFSKLDAGVRHLSARTNIAAPAVKAVNMQSLSAVKNSNIFTKSLAERVADYQMPHMQAENISLAGLSLSAASADGSVNGLDSLYYAVGVFYVSDTQSETKTWEMRVYGGEGDTVILQNFMPMTGLERPTQLKAIYKNNKLRILNGQYVAYVTYTDAVYDLFFTDYFNQDERYYDLEVSADGSDINTPSGGYVAYIVQKQVSENHEYMPEAEGLYQDFWDLMFAGEYSTDASIQPNIITMYGKGVDWSTYSNVYWTMQAKEGKNDTVWFADVIPPFVSSLSEITTYGIRKDGKVTIPYSEVLYTYSNGTYAINLVNLSNSTEDNVVISNIVLTENEDGTFSAPDEVSYAYWASPIVDGKPDFYDDEAGFYSAVSNVVYSATDYEVKAPEPNAEADGVTLYLFADDEYSPYGPYAIAAGNRSLTYTSTTPAPYDSIYWSMAEYDPTAESLVTVQNFESTTDKLTAYLSYVDFYGSPDIYAWYGGEMGAKNVNAYTYFAAYGTSLIFPYGMYSEYDGYHVSSAQLDRRISRTNYSEPTQDGEQISSLYSYQGKPHEPLYFESVTLACCDLTSSSATDGWRLLIRRCSRDAEGNIVPGDTIAISDANISNWRATAENSGVQYGFLTFEDFYIEDEDGFDTELETDYFNITDEFMFELQGFDSSKMQGYIWSEYMYDANGSKFTGYSTTEDPTTVKYDEYNNARLFFCFDNFIYGLLLTDDATSITVPADGGVYSWTITPYLAGYDDAGNSTTALWTKEGTDPDWIHWTIPTENYTTDRYFVLQIAVDALPDGMTGRSCNVEFEQWGAALEIEILQGDATSGIQGVQTEARAYKAMVNGDNIIVSCPSDVKEVSLYDALGARVATVPVVAGKATISGARQGLNIVNFGGKNSVKVVK
jgi:hypothetical protein